MNMTYGLRNGCNASGSVLSIPARGKPADGLLARVGAVVLGWQERATQRSRLSEMEPRLLADMGIDPTVAAREAAKPFWRA